MAVTASLVYQGHDTLRYLLTQDGNAGTSLTITTTGAASPDLLTDSLAGPLKVLAKAFSDGFMTMAAGALTQAQSRGLWLSDWSGAALILGPTAKARITPRSATSGAGWLVDANVDGSGNPTVVITAQAGAATCYLDIEVAGMQGV